MMIKFEEEVEQLTGRTRPMGVKEILLERATNKGLEKGRQEERVKAEEEKKELARDIAIEKALEMARNFKKIGISAVDISKGTGLSIEEIEAL